MEKNLSQKFDIFRNTLNSILRVTHLHLRFTVGVCERKRNGSTFGMPTPRTIVLDPVLAGLWELSWDNQKI